MYDWKKIEEEIREYWEANQIPQKLSAFDASSEKKKFYLLDGPPYANDSAHTGHLMTIAFKDVWGKFKKMQGYEVWFQPGFDCHGLPIEVKMREKLGTKTKEEIENFGMDKFIDACREFSTMNMNNWMELYKKLGAWKAWLDPYFTYQDSYIESDWWTLKTIYEKGLLVQGEKPIHWCPSCETAIAGYEATDEYADLEDPSVYIKFPVKGKDNEYLLAWTTTPWTLPANVALLVHPEEVYVRVRVDDEVLILAKPLLDAVMKKAGKEYEVIEEFPGKELEGMSYEPLLNIPIQRELNERAHKVYVSVPIMKEKVASKVAEKKGIESKETFEHLVTMDAGTGIVHTAPGHGAEDNQMGQHYNLPMLSPIDDRGCLMEGTEFEGKFAKDADPEITERLRTENKLFHSEKIKHSYPLCTRCKTPLLYRLSSQWFITIDPLKERLLKANKEIKWMPEFAEKRMHNWMDNATDWCVSRQIFWGIPLPIWKCECGSIDVIGSKAELQEKMTNDIELNDLHRHVVDKVKIKCQCGNEMERVKDTADVWLDSGTGAWASLGYPHKNKELFEKLWNVDIVNEGQDQIRGWFYHLIFAGMATFGEKTTEAMCLNGWIIDEKGNKMSKSKGNVVWAHDAYNQLGADIARLYHFTQAAPWDVMKYSLEGAKELERYLITLMNLENFVSMYDLDLNAKSEITLDENRWILSRLNNLTKEVTDDLENFRFHYVGKKLNKFLLEDFSRFYMKLIKNKISDHKDEISFTIRSVLDTYLRLLAPICPFVTERVYQSLIKNKDSVHMESWPEAGPVDKELEARFEVMDKVIETSNSLRQDAGVGLRYPIKSLTISGSDEIKSSLSSIQDTIKEMANVKEVLIGEETAEIEVKPNYKSLGGKFGKDVPKIVSGLTEEKIGELLENEEAEIEGHRITKEDIIITESSEDGKTFRSPYGTGIVQIDTEETQEILDESLVRELIRKVQEARKEKGLKVADRITLTIKTDHRDIVDKWKDEIEKDTGSSLEYGEASNKAEYKGREILFEVGS